MLINCNEQVRNGKYCIYYVYLKVFLLTFIKIETHFLFTGGHTIGSKRWETQASRVR